MAALSEIQKLEARYAENPDGRFFAPLADAYRKAGDVDRALELVQGNLAKHPDYLSAHIVLGRCFLDKKDDAGASRAFRRVLDLDSENIIALKSLAEISERMGETDEARSWLMRLLTVDAMNAEAEEDLKRLGGPIQEATQATEAKEATEETEANRISFADLTEPESPPSHPSPPAPPSAPSLHEETTVPMEAINLDVPRTLERPAVTVPAPEPAPEPVVPMMDLEPTAYSEPAPAPAASDVTAPEPQPEDRRERIRTADELNVEERKATRERVSESEFEGFGVAPTHDADVSEVPPLVLEAPMEPPTVAIVDEPRAPEQGLQLIMPEDVTPPDEMRRPSHKLIQAVAPEESRSDETAQAAAPLASETMADLYLQQGLKSQAAEVYRRLLEQRPNDESLLAKLKSIETPPAMSAAALGTEAVGSWLRRIARSALPAGAPAAPPVPPAPTEQTPMDQAFSEPEPEPMPLPVPEPIVQSAEIEDDRAGTRPAPAESAPAEAAQAGEPARPASTAYSLDSIFGGGQGAPAAEAPPPKHSLGASFDEFFGASASPQADSSRPREGDAPKSGGDDDLSAFNAWLHGLKS